eukprot:10907303-Alexandrium_andersonii.AAC.1
MAAGPRGGAGAPFARRIAEKRLRVETLPEQRRTADSYRQPRKRSLALRRIRCDDVAMRAERRRAETHASATKALRATTMATAAVIHFGACVLP